jgi:hypothetical protein
VVEKGMQPLETRPRKISKRGGSYQMTIPQTFFLLAGIDPEEPLEGRSFIKDGRLVVEVSPIQK